MQKYDKLLNTYIKKGRYLVAKEKKNTLFSPKVEKHPPQHYK